MMMRRKRRRNGATLATAIGIGALAAGLSGCVVEEKGSTGGSTRSRTTDASSGGDRNVVDGRLMGGGGAPPGVNRAREPIETQRPLGYQSSTSVGQAFVSPMGSIEYDGLTLPVVQPGGGFIATVEGAPPTWDAVLARKGAGVGLGGVIVVYRIDIPSAGGSTGGRDAKPVAPRLVEHHRIEHAGLLGRNADAEGFLVESPQADGGRWIGKASWETGEIEWLVKEETNAFAAVGPEGRLAWCRRGLLEDRFSLMVQGSAEVLSVPAPVDGQWLMPSWSSDGRTVFAFRLGDQDGALDVVAFNVQSRETIRRPFAERRLLRAATEVNAYDAVSGFQEPAARDATTRMMFYHPGIARVCVFDPRRTGVQMLAADSLTGAWGDEFVLAATDRAMLWQKITPSGVEGAELLSGAFAPRRTESVELPFVLLSPSQGRLGELNVFALRVFTDAAEAAAAER